MLFSPDVVPEIAVSTTARRIAGMQSSAQRRTIAKSSFVTSVRPANLADPLAN
jgi:hypothetical protein